jgi:hypothetical protein
LAAFLLGKGWKWESLSKNGREAVTAWLQERGLISRKSGKKKPGADYQITETYQYHDTQGRPNLRKHRWEAEGKEKFFTWEHLEGDKWAEGRGGFQPAMYRSHEIRDAPCVQIHEGEGKVNRAFELGFSATCVVDGANSWRREYAPLFAGKHVELFPDNDETGRTCSHIIAADIFKHVASVKIVYIPGLPEKGDIVDWLASGGTREQLEKIIAETPEWKPETGAEILDSVFGFIRRFVFLTETQSRVCALWVAHAHAINAASFTPYLHVRSTEKQEGKSRLCRVLKMLTPNAYKTDNISPAALIYMIDEKPGTLILDELDAKFRGDKDAAEILRGIIDSGFELDGTYTRCVGEGRNISVRHFRTFCPKVLSGIGRLPGTVEDRSIPIKMKRAKKGTVPKLRQRGKQAQRIETEAASIKARLGAWCAHRIAVLQDAEPAIPEALSDRQSDACEQLFAIADAAGGHWPQAARKAVVELCAHAQVDDGSIGATLLADVKGIFCPHDDDGNPMPELEHVASAGLVEALAKIEGRPWAEWGKAQKPITQNQLAKLLYGYSDSKDRPIAPRNIRFGTRVLRGYEREQFTEAWARYLPPETLVNGSPSPESGCYTATSRINTGENGDSQDATAERCSTSENAVSANKDAPCSDVADQNEGEGSKEKVEVEWEA